MQHFDVFNGDADGLCSLIQLRRSEPKESTLVTGIKRDIDLVKRVKAVAGDSVTVLDVSFDKNAAAVQQLIQTGVVVEYFDHHQADQLSEHQNLRPHINTAADVCTALIVDNYLGGRYRDWALTAAFGDNLTSVAYQLGKDSGFSDVQLSSLQRLGICLNYNGYGANLEDLFFDPARLFEKLQPFDSAFDFLEQDGETFAMLDDGYQDDMSRARHAPYIYQSECAAVISLPNQKWARRVSGVFGNSLANDYADRAHAVVTEKANGNYLVSVRAPLTKPEGADVLVSQFPTGGGRKGAAGINDLAASSLGNFVDAFTELYE